LISSTLGRPAWAAAVGARRFEAARHRRSTWTIEAYGSAEVSARQAHGGFTRQDAVVFGERFEFELAG
jgi:hypothetical protein